MSRCPCRGRRPPGPCRECQRAASAAPASTPMAGPNDALRAALPRLKFDNVLTTLRPSSVEIRVDGRAHRSSVLPSSAPLPAIAWQLDRLHPVLLACASGLIACTSWDVSTGCAEPWHLLPGVCHICTDLMSC